RDAVRRGWRASRSASSGARLPGDEVDEIDLGDDAGDFGAVEDDHHLPLPEEVGEHVDAGSGLHGGEVALDEAVDGVFGLTGALEEMAHEIGLGDDPDESALIGDRNLADAVLGEEPDDIADVVPFARGDDAAALLAP